MASALVVCAGISHSQAAENEAVVQLFESGHINERECLNIGRADCSVAVNLEALASIIERYRRTGTTANGKPLNVLRVVIPPGIHRLSRPFVIKSWGTSPPYPALVIEGAGQAKTYLLGSLTVPQTEWQIVGPTELSNSAAVTNTRSIDYQRLTGHRMRSDSRAELFGANPQPLLLAVSIDGHAMTLARWPNEHYTTIKDVSGSTSEGFRIHFADSGIEHIPIRGAMISGYLYYDWAYERVPIAPDPTDSHAVLIPAGGTTFGVRAGQRVFVENSLAELDSPNEWFFDEASQKLYFWVAPPNLTKTAALEIAVVDELFSIEGSRNIRVEGLSLENNLGDALHILNSSSIAIEHVAIRDVGNRAVAIEGGQNDAIDDCVIENVGTSGINIFGGDRNSLTPGKHRVQNSVISRIGQRLKSYQPAISLQGVGNSAVGNLIFDTPHAAIVFSGNNHLIEANNITDVVRESDDAGAIYTGRDWAARGTIIRNNFVQNVKGRGGNAGQAVGLYLDDQASGVTAEGNIFANVTKGILVGGGRDNTIDGNVFFNNRYGIVVDARGITWQRAETQDASGFLRKNLQRVPYQSSIYRNSYPHLAELLDDSPGTPKYNEIRWNAFVDSGGIQEIDPGYFSWSETENLRFDVDLFRRAGAVPVTSPEAFEVNMDKLPPNWPADYPARQLIPRLDH